ncbi:glutathione peroxidase [Thalassotalea sp. HSM 43]|uniref:glutathione peroxidase n=1 Tax=Thalassotalea sp. HSM 43 TaxID=2552945 RepID=UPI00108077C4|nr:glutathione peroxidase [Thalassotalea sp. HSM 43]QBY02897.1 glutathione peroxidase [Thalassotalea sp. HSM 43]
MSQLYDFSVTNNKGETVPLLNYQNKVLLIVNTASACGFTPQYDGLENLYQAYKDKGLAVLAFPCNQFGEQEKGSDDDIRNFCDLNFHINFDLFAKVDVNGDKADPLFDYLTQQAKGILGSKKIKWNFTKFLVNRQGEVIKRYGSIVKPEKIAKDIEQLL